MPLKSFCFKQKAHFTALFFEIYILYLLLFVLKYFFAFLVQICVLFFKSDKFYFKLLNFKY